MFVQKWQKDANFREEVLKQKKLVKSSQGASTTRRAVPEKCSIPLDFRFADEEDAQDVASLINEAYSIEKGDTGEAFKNCDCTNAEEVADSIKSGDCRWYLAEARDKNETLLACCCFSMPPATADFGAPAQLRMLGVRPTHQYMRVGSHVLKCVEAVILAMGTKSVMIAIPNWRASAAKFCKGRGYKEACQAPFPEPLRSILTRDTTLVGFKKELKSAQKSRAPKLSLSAPALPASNPAAGAKGAGATTSCSTAQSSVQATAPQPKAKKVDVPGLLEKLSISSNNPDLYDDTLADLLENKTQPLVSRAPPRPPQQPDEKEFEAWAKANGRKYTTAESRLHRLETWRKNKAKIDAHNQRFKEGKVDYEAELNIFADLTDEEYAKYEKYKKLHDLGELPEDSHLASPGSSLSELAKYGGAESYDSRGVKVESLTGPTTRGPLMTALDSESADETNLTRSVFRRKEAEAAEEQKKEEEGIMYGMGFEEKKQYLIGMFKGEQLTQEQFKKKMEQLLEEQPKEPEGGVVLTNNYQSSFVTHNGFSSA